MSSKRPRDDDGDGGVELFPEGRRRKLDERNDVSNELPSLPSRGCSSLRSLKAFSDSVQSMAKDLKSESAQKDELKNECRKIEEIVNLILHKIHSGDVEVARDDLNKVGKGISEHFSGKENDTRVVREKYATAAFFYEFFMSGKLAMKVIDSNVNFAKKSPSYGSTDLVPVRLSSFFTNLCLLSQQQ
jgi:hypothetical protein